MDDSPFLTLQAVQTARAARHLAHVLLGLFLITVLFLALTPWQQSALGQGRVVAYAPLDRQQTLEAPLDGRIVRWYVREGSRVRKDDPIVDISDLDPTLLDRLRRERDALKERLDAATLRARSVEGRIEDLGSARAAAVSAAGERARMAADRVRAAEQALRAAEAARETARINQERQQGLFEKGLSSARAVELAELERVRTATEEERARAALDAARSEERALRTDQERASRDGGAALNDARAARAAALAEVAAASAELVRLDVRLSRQAAQAVRAPRAGTVLRLLANQDGEIVKAGDPLAVLVPSTDERAVELWVDGNDAPLLSEGQEVRIQFEGWPALQFTGWPSVAVGTFGGRIAVIDATDDGKGKFRALVVPDPGEPWPSPRYLRQGVRASGWVLLGRVRLGYELWRQWNGFPPVIAPAEPGEPGAAPKKETR